MARSRKGCWTCRIRHRRCDETLPLCKECTTRHITCHGYEVEAPEWMKDEQRLQAELQRIKSAVKENFRRIKKLQNRPVAANPLRGISCASHSSQSDSLVAAPPRNTTFREAQHLVHYLDYIFPIQYTFYVHVPDLGGRGWLFWLLMRSAPLRNAALTLSAFHQHSTSPSRTEDQVDELLRYHTKALQELRQVVSRREEGGFAGSREEWIEFVAGGLFLISFEVFQGGIDNWEPHLNAAVSIIAELSPTEFGSHPPSPSNRDFDYLRGMDTAERFLIVNILWFDLCSCVAIGGAPQMAYYEWLTNPTIDMANVMGCHNSIMMAIGDLATLEAKASSLSCEELQRRVYELEEQVHKAISDINNNMNIMPTIRTVSNLFSSAALVQLSTLALENNITMSPLHESVSRVLAAIDQLPSHVSIRGTPWPICVGGCMASPGQQPRFEQLCQDALNRSESGFTNCGTVLRVIKHAWMRRGQTDEMWSAKRAMSEMGICALLI